jgi:acyl-CoA thioester hydrolase
VTEPTRGGKPQKTPHEKLIYNVAVRWSDMDAYGHVNNARFLTLFEEARVEMFFVGARAHGLGSFEEGIVISRHEIDYLRPVDYGDPVRIEMWISEMRVASFTVSYELYDGDVLASRAKSVCVPYNLTNAHPRRLSPEEREFLKPYLAGTD